MLYLIAILLPPLAVLLCGRPGAAILNFFLVLLFYVPGLIHALLVVGEYKADRRTDQLVRAMAQTKR